MDRKPWLVRVSEVRTLLQFRGPCAHPKVQRQNPSDLQFRGPLAQFRMLEHTSVEGHMVHIGTAS